MEITKLGTNNNKPSKDIQSFDKPEQINYIKMESNELVCKCPITEQPDIYKLVIEYNPKERCIESKSLKLYLWTFAQEKMFGEFLANTILCDVVLAIDPFWCCVTTVQNIRGGIEITSVAELGER